MSSYRIRMKPRGALNKLSYPAFSLVFLLILTIHSSRPLVHSLIGAAAATVLLVLPGLAFYIRQLQLSLGVELLVDMETRSITLASRRGSTKVSFDEIQTVKMISSYPVAENRIRWMSTDYFFYFAIELLNQQVIIVTCLMIGSYEINTRLLELDGRRPQVVKRLFPFINYPSNAILNFQRS